MRWGSCADLVKNRRALWCCCDLFKNDKISNSNLLTFSIGQISSLPTQMEKQALCLYMYVYMFSEHSRAASKSVHERGGKNIVQRWWPRRRSLNGVISAPLSGHFGTGGPAANCTLPQGEKNWQDTRGAWATFDSVTEMSQFRETKAKYLFYDVWSGQLLAAFWSFS